MRIAGLAGMAALAANLLAAAPDVTVYVDGAGAGFNLQTKALAGRMFAAAGVQVVWRIGAPKPDAAGGLVVGVRFTEAPSPSYQRGVLARAYPFGGGVRAVTVFHNRIRAIADASGTQEFKVTAHVLVHEIEHVLERLDRHSDTGVMKAHWDLADYQAMARKPLPFAGEDIAWIRRFLEDLRGPRPSAGGE